MNYYAELIKGKVTMNDICQKYGIEVNRNGFASCIFHEEKTASLKVFPDSRGWYCFGCNTGGSVIDFIKQLFGVDYKEAIRILDRDFAIGLFEKRTLSQFRKHQKEIERIRRSAEEKKQRLQELDDRYWSVFDLWKDCDDAIRLYKPKNPGDEWDERYVAALHKMPYLENMLDELLGV